MRRRQFVLAGTSVLLAGSVAGVGYTLAAKSSATDPAPPVPIASAPVTRGTVTERLRLAGTYGYDGSYSVVHQGQPGIVTAEPDPGSTVERGGILYRVEDRPVRLLFGSVPAYRDFAQGMPDGPDVQQLSANLVALGMDPLGQLKADNHFTASTAAAIRRWQASWGLAAAQRTGAIALGQIVFLPEALRIGEAVVSPGRTAMPN